MNNEKTILETGATSAAVNELILYTDNSKELAERRDNIYKSLLTSDNVDYIDFVELVFNAMATYRIEMNTDISLSLDERQEYCQIYTNRFEEWKKEKERHQKQTS